MNKIVSYVFTATALWFLSCSCNRSTEENFVGQWVQNVNLPETGISGIEAISLNKDHTLTGINRLEYSEDNNYFKCNLRFVTEMTGTWEYDKGNLALHFDPESFTFREDSTSFTLEMSGKGGDTNEFEKLKPTLGRKVIHTLDSMYRGFYTSPAISNLKIENATVVSGNILQGEASGQPITYSRAGR